MIITRLLVSKYNDKKLRSYPLNEKTIQELRKVIDQFDPNKKQRLIVSYLTDDQKSKMSTPPDAFLEFVEDQQGY